MTYPGSERPTFADRLADPLSHFPYKETKARRAAGDDDAAQAEVGATAAYVAAQQALFEDPTPERRADERAAADELQRWRRLRRTERDALALVAALEQALAAAEEDDEVPDEAFEAMQANLERAQAAAEEAAGQLAVALADHAGQEA